MQFLQDKVAIGLVEAEGDETVEEGNEDEGTREESCQCRKVDTREECSNVEGHWQSRENKWSNGLKNFPNMTINLGENSVSEGVLHVLCAGVEDGHLAPQMLHNFSGAEGRDGVYQSHFDGHKNRQTQTQEAVALSHVSVHQTHQGSPDVDQRTESSVHGLLDHVAVSLRLYFQGHIFPDEEADDNRGDGENGDNPRGQLQVEARKSPSIRAHGSSLSSHKDEAAENICAGDNVGETSNEAEEHVKRLCMNGQLTT